MNDVKVSLPFGLYEVLDRASVYMEHFSEKVFEHEAVQEDPELKALAEKVQDAMMDMYQCAGSKWYQATKDIPGMWITPTPTPGEEDTDD